MGFLLALGFLTTIPIGPKTKVTGDRLSKSTVYFPLVGLFLGLILAGANNLLLFFGLEQFLVNVLLVILLILLTGGLHLDGLADTFDAISSNKSKDEMLRIMRDSSLGTMGVLSLICVLSIKVAILGSLHPGIRSVSLILMCLLSRYSLVFLIYIFPYARDDGKARLFIEGMNLKRFVLASIIALFFSVLLFKLSGLLVVVLAVIFASLVGRFFVKKIDGITGDTLGAISELTEVFILFSILALTGAGA